MPRIEMSVLIRAPRDGVIAIARDNESFPEFMTDVDSLVVREKSDDGLRVVSDWVGIVPKFGTRIRWTQEDVWDLEAGTCAFRQLQGDYEELEGVWTFTADGPNVTRFDSILNCRIEIPLVGPLIQTIIHKTVEANVDAALRAIKDRCEGH